MSLGALHSFRRCLIRQILQVVETDRSIFRTPGYHLIVEARVLRELEDV